MILKSQIDMSDKNYEDSFLCRKKFTNSFRRHFSLWKRRIFKLDPIEYTLLILNPDTSINTKLELLTVTLNEEYQYTSKLDSTDEDLSLTIIDRTLEINIKFDDVVTKSKWLNKIKELTDEVGRLRIESFTLCHEYLLQFLLEKRSFLIDKYWTLDIYENSNQFDCSMHKAKPPTMSSSTAAAVDSSVDTTAAIVASSHIRKEAYQEYEIRKAYNYEDIINNTTTMIDSSPLSYIDNKELSKSSMCPTTTTTTKASMLPLLSDTYTDHNISYMRKEETNKNNSHPLNKIKKADSQNDIICIESSDDSDYIMVNSPLSSKSKKSTYTYTSPTITHHKGISSSIFGLTENNNEDSHNGDEDSHNGDEDSHNGDGGSGIWYTRDHHHPTSSIDIHISPSSSSSSSSSTHTSYKSSSQKSLISTPSLLSSPINNTVNISTNNEVMNSQVRSDDEGICTLADTDSSSTHTNVHLYHTSKLSSIQPSTSIHKKDNSYHHPAVINIHTDFKQQLKRLHSIQQVTMNTLIEISPPSLHIVIMVVGTRGDLEPFLHIGKLLSQQGHRVRIASHACYRDYILTYYNGLEFYPLGGDPKILSEFMVKNHGCLVPLTSETLFEVPQHMTMLNDILESCWDACVTPDPSLPPKSDNPSTTNTTYIHVRPFHAQAIISNPVTYGHIHCAEALNIPLHLMFPQPWLPTKAFPHPLSCLPYKNTWTSDNKLSYQVVDTLLWMSLQLYINNFRVKKLNLPPIQYHHSGCITPKYVPFVKMWSPYLIPKPKDWPYYVDIVGTFHNTSVINTLQSTHDSLASADVISNKDLLDVMVGRRKSIDNNKIVKDKDMNRGLSVDTNNIPQQLPETSENIAKCNDYNKPIQPQTLDSFKISDNMPCSQNEDKVDNDKYSSNVATMDISDTISLQELIPRFIQRYREYHSSVNTTTTSYSHTSFSSPVSPSSFTNLMKLPLYIGFGSMILSDPETVISILIEAAAMNNIPVILQCGWTTLSQEKFKQICHQAELNARVLHDTNRMINSRSTIFSADPTHSSHCTPVGHTNSTTNLSMNNNTTATASLPQYWSAEYDALMIGPCEHTWLFQYVSAVIHHGGAGTTSAGLLAGKPTWICPFFGDQYFWGEMIKKKTLGPTPCPISQLTISRAADSIYYLYLPHIIQSAHLISKVMLQENGAQEAVKCFNKHLPLHTMLCDVSIQMKQSVLAEVYCYQCEMKMSKQVSTLLHEYPLRSHHTIVPYTKYCHYTYHKKIRNNIKKSKDSTTIATMTPDMPSLEKQFDDLSTTLINSKIESADTGVQTSDDRLNTRTISTSSNTGDTLFNLIQPQNMISLIRDTLAQVKSHITPLTSTNSTKNVLIPTDKLYGDIVDSPTNTNLIRMITERIKQTLSIHTPTTLMNTNDGDIIEDEDNINLIEPSGHSRGYNSDMMMTSSSSTMYHNMFQIQLYDSDRSTSSSFYNHPPSSLLPTTTPRPVMYYDDRSLYSPPYSEQMNTIESKSTNTADKEKSDNVNNVVINEMLSTASIPEAQQEFDTTNPDMHYQPTDRCNLSANQMNENMYFDTNIQHSNIIMNGNNVSDKSLSTQSIHLPNAYLSYSGQTKSYSIYNQDDYDDEDEHVDIDDIHSDDSTVTYENENVNENEGDYKEGEDNELMNEEDSSGGSDHNSDGGVLLAHITQAHMKKKSSHIKDIPMNNILSEDSSKHTTIQSQESTQTCSTTLNTIDIVPAHDLLMIDEAMDTTKASVQDSILVLDYHDNTHIINDITLHSHKVVQLQHDSNNTDVSEFIDMYQSQINESSISTCRFDKVEEDVKDSSMTEDHNTLVQTSSICPSSVTTERQEIMKLRDDNIIPHSRLPSDLSLIEDQYKNATTIQMHSFRPPSTETTCTISSSSPIVFTDKNNLKTNTHHHDVLTHDDNECTQDIQIDQVDQIWRNQIEKAYQESLLVTYLMKDILSTAAYTYEESGFTQKKKSIYSGGVTQNHGHNSSQEDMKSIMIPLHSFLSAFQTWYTQSRQHITMTTNSSSNINMHDMTLFLQKIIGENKSDMIGYYELSLLWLAALEHQQHKTVTMTMTMKK